MTVWSAEIKNFESDGKTTVAAVATSREDFIKKVCCGCVCEDQLCNIAECKCEEACHEARMAYAEHGAAALKCPWCLAWRYYDIMLGTWRDCFCV